MLRTTQDLIDLRRWAEARRGRPCRDEETGRLRIAFPGEACHATRDVGWEEFEPTFRVVGWVAVYDDAPGSTRHFLGEPEAARRFVAEGNAPLYAPSPP